MESFILLCISLATLALTLGARSRIDVLTKRIETLEQGWGIQGVSVVTSDSPQPGIQHAPRVSAPVLVAQMPPHEAGFDVLNWVRKDWLLKLGVLCVLAACGWFVSYAFMSGWVGPLGRIAFGLVLGASVLVFGWWRMQTFKDQGAIFVVLGASIVLVTLFAARTLYDFFTPTSALLLMFATSVFVGYVSFVYRHRNLAIMSVLLGSAAPLLVHSPTTDYIGLFTYLLAVLLGGLTLVYHTGYREITFVSFMVFAFYSGAHIMDGGVDDRLMVFGYVFAAIFFIANIIGMVRRGFVSTAYDATLAFANALLLLGYIATYVQDEFKSLVVAAWMLVFAVGSFMALKLTHNRVPFFIYACVGSMYLAAATAFELEGPALTIAYAIEAALLTIVAFRLTGDRGIAERVSVLLLGSAVLATPSLLSSAWARGIVHSDALVIVLTGGIFLAIGSILQARGGEEVRTDGTHHVYLPWQQIGGGIFLLIFIWLATHALMAYGAATMVSLVLYVLWGLVTYYTGIMQGSSRMKVVGATLLLGSIARLLLVDVWMMSLEIRIFTFFVIGILLLATAFIKKQK
ncbi:MAG: hypothetical protein RLZZ234_304 [Candidatus Parcubacteria bacterium]|jgi:uncharacterized membrane protein